MKLRCALTLLMLAMGLVFALPAWAQEKPFTEQQVLDMVRAGLGNDSGAKLIVQRGIDFTPTQDSSNASSPPAPRMPFLKALRANKPLSQQQVNRYGASRTG